MALSTKGPEPMEPDEACSSEGWLDSVICTCPESDEVKKVLGRIDKDGDGKMNFRDRL